MDERSAIIVRTHAEWLKLGRTLAEVTILRRHSDEASVVLSLHPCLRIARPAALFVPQDSRADS